MIPRFHGIIRNGILKPFNQKGLDRYIRSFKDGAAVTITIKDKVTESDPLRRYYWSVVVKMVADMTGHSREAIHEAFKQKYVGYTDEYGLSVTRSVFGKKSDMTRGEKWDFIMAVRSWAHDFLDLAIPDPDPEWKKAA